MRVLTIAGNTFRENIRDKVLYNLILFALLMILSSFVLGQLTLGYEDKVIIDLGLSSISVFGTLIAIFIGIGLVYKELERRTVYALLAKPVHRWEFILGKYLGLLFTLLVNVAIMTVGLALTLAYHGGVSLSGYLHLLPAVYLIFLSLALTTAVALLFSAFSTPALSALFTFFLWIIGHFNADLLQFARLTKSAVAEFVSMIFYYVLPNISNFSTLDSRNVIQSAAYYEPINAAAIGWATVYAILYCSVLLAAAATIFSRRDFK
ncbi:MAG: ABC transporter permease [Acidobacteriia bacterium]|nr:ABC transporter permease [Terriglobia bacterium]